MEVAVLVVVGVVVVVVLVVVEVAVVGTFDVLHRPHSLGQ